MSAFTHAIDTTMSRSVGQNGHAQEEWRVGDFQDSMVQLYFQIVRCASNSTRRFQLCKIKDEYKKLIHLATLDQTSRKPLNLCMSLMFQTRDLQGGKGEYHIFYHLLTCWESYWNIVSDQLNCALTLLVDTEYASQKYDITFSHPYGSWKDAKNILNVYREVFNWGGDTSRWTQHHATRHIVAMASDALSCDVGLVSKGCKPRTLVAKWLPREKSSLYGWQAKIFAESWCRKPGKNIQASLSTYRRKCSQVNKALETTQIKQCAKEWASIDFEKEVTSITMQKQKAAFLACGKNTEAAELQDRKECAANFRQYLADVASGKKKIKAARVVGEQLVKQLWNNTISEEEKGYANAVWEEVVKDSSDALANALVMLDLSASMTWDNCPFYAAIYLALKIACSKGGTKRVMTFSDEPSWINLEDCTTLVEMVDVLKENAHSTEMSTNIYKAFELVGAACLNRDMTPDEVGSQMVVILSDMQINQADRSHTPFATLEENIKLDFQRLGLRSSHKQPYPRPTLVFWNMKSTQGFPCSVVRENTILMSGYNTDVLESVSAGGMQKLTDLSPWDHIRNILDKPRYNWFW